MHCASCHGERLQYPSSSFDLRACIRTSGALRNRRARRQGVHAHAAAGAASSSAGLVSSINFGPTCARTPTIELGGLGRVFISAQECLLLSATRTSISSRVLRQAPCAGSRTPASRAGGFRRRCAVVACLFAPNAGRGSTLVLMRSLPAHATYWLVRRGRSDEHVRAGRGPWERVLLRMISAANGWFSYLLQSARLSVLASSDNPITELAYHSWCIRLHLEFIAHRNFGV